MAVQLSLAGALADLGVAPGAVVGCSLGEIAAAATCGVLTSADAVRFAARRGAAIEVVSDGAMLALDCARGTAEELAAGRLDVAIEYFDDVTVLAGDRAAAAAVREDAARCGIATTWVRSPWAAHSRLLEPFVDDVVRVAASYPMSPPSGPLMDPECGAPATASLTDPAYWGRHLRRSRHFGAALSAALDAAGGPAAAVVELSPLPSIAAMARQSSTAPDIRPIVRSGSATFTESNWDELVDWLAGLGHLGGPTGRVSRRADQPVIVRGPSAIGLATVVDEFRAVLGADIGPDAHFIEAGGNSLLAMELLVRLEERSGRRVALRDFLRAATPRRITDLLTAGSVRSASRSWPRDVWTAPGGVGSAGVRPRIGLQLFAGAVNDPPR